MAYILGLDIGYSNMKLAGGEHGALNPTVLLRPAGTAPAERVAIPLASAEEGLRVTVKEQAWVAGVAQERLGSWHRALHPNFTSTDDYLSLFLSLIHI